MVRRRPRRMRWTNVNGDKIVALSPAVFDNRAHCNKVSSLFANDTSLLSRFAGGRNHRTGQDRICHCTR